MHSPDHSLSSASDTSSDQPHFLNPDQYNDEITDADRSRQPLDAGLTAHLQEIGHMDLHFINKVIHKVTDLHNKIDQGNRVAKMARLTDTSKQLYYLHKEINKNKSADTRQRHQEEYNNLQRDLCMEFELKEKAKQLRIQNFYKSRNGKLNTTSFYLVKEKQPPRTIKRLLHNGQDITDPEEIVNIMQEWYGNTASQEHAQTEYLPTLMQELNLQLPQISQECKDMLDEEITPDEVEAAINEAHEISALGPSG
jgi:hypothetical protein